MVNGGKRANVNVGDYKFQARELDEGRRPVGPETQLTVVVLRRPPRIYSCAAGRAERPGILPGGQYRSSILYAGRSPADERFVQVV